MIDALEAGALLEPGSPLASVKYDSRRVPSWKEEFIARIGQDEAEKVIANTEPKHHKEARHHRELKGEEP